MFQKKQNKTRHEKKSRLEYKIIMSALPEVRFWFCFFMKYYMKCSSAMFTAASKLYEIHNRFSVYFV